MTVTTMAATEGAIRATASAAFSAKSLADLKPSPNQIISTLLENAATINRGILFFANRLMNYKMFR
jgi:hypothetical protein